MKLGKKELLSYDHAYFSNFFDIFPKKYVLIMA